MKPEPTIDEFLKAAKSAVQGQADKNADYIRGSEYDVLAGASAILWSREAQRDTDLFRATKFHTASDLDLTNLVPLRYGIARYLDTRGTGTATLYRPAGGVVDTVWKGTRLRVRGTDGDPKYYRVTTNVPVEAADLYATLSIEAVKFGSGTNVEATSNVDIDDPLTDPTWTVSYLKCTEGTDFEPAADLIARVRQTRLDNRVGYPKAIIDACKAVGAAQVVVLRSDFGGDANDKGLNVTYVGDSGYSGSASLVKACTVAVRSARVAGDHMQVLPMARVLLDITADVYLSDAPGNFDTARLETLHHAALRQALNGSSGNFGYTQIGLMSAITRNSPEVQDVVFSSPTIDVNTLDVTGNFPAVLNRYAVGNISLRYLAP